MFLEDAGSFLLPSARLAVQIWAIPKSPGHMYKVEARYHKAGSGGQGKILVSSWPRPREEGLESTECHDLAQAALAQA